MPDTNPAVCDYLQENAPFFFIGFDADGVARRTNRFTTSLLGAAVGRAFHEVFVDFSGTLNLAALARDPGQWRRQSVSVKSGLPQTIQCSFHRAGDMILAIGHLDISEMQALQRSFIELNNELNVVMRELQKANAQLHKLNELKNRFVGFAAHDLRRPLGVISSYTEFLQAEARDSLTPEHREFLDIIQSRAATMVQLIEELLDIAMIESGRNEPKLHTTDLADIFHTVELTMQNAAQKKQVRLATTLDPAVPRLNLDALKIEQATLNLLGNAVEHTRPGTTVTLKAQRDGAQVVVSVTDQGPGIPATMLDKLFQPFTRGPSQKEGGHESHGLGLAIAKRMIDAHGGRIWAENRPGEGARFSYSLPIQREIKPLG